MIITQKKDGLDADRVAPGLYVGSTPPEGKLPFDVLVLAAKEHQPRGVYEKTAVVHIPLDDNFAGMNHDEVAGAMQVARDVAASMRAGHRVLVTCMAGKNRSALIAALAVRLRYGANAATAIQVVRQARPGALSNPHFVNLIGQIPVSSRFTP